MVCCCTQSVKGTYAPSGDEGAREASLGGCCSPEPGAKAEPEASCCQPVQVATESAEPCCGPSAASAEVRDDDVRSAVRERYGKIAKGSSEGAEAVCCAPHCADDVSQVLGYSTDELADLPDGANLGLGCGNPQRIAMLKPGETVLDLGSGGGVDCFLAARQVGPGGLIIGVDMTPDMITKARENARKAGAENIEFRLGEIEHLPVADNTVDVIMSNCVINLAPDKRAVYSEAYRVLKPGGRLAISDVLAIAEMPEELKRDKELLCSCVSGALGVEETRGILADAGFTDIGIKLNEQSGEFIQHWATGRGLEKLICAAVITAVKPT